MAEGEYATAEEQGQGKYAMRLHVGYLVCRFRGVVLQAHTILVEVFKEVQLLLGMGTRKVVLGRQGQS